MLASFGFEGDRGNDDMSAQGPRSHEGLLILALTVVMVLIVGPGVLGLVAALTLAGGLGDAVRLFGTAISISLVLVFLGALALWRGLADDLSSLPRRAFWICLTSYLVGIMMIQSATSIRAFSPVAYNFRALVLDPMGTIALILGGIWLVRWLANKARPK